MNQRETTRVFLVFMDLIIPNWGWNKGKGGEEKGASQSCLKSYDLPSQRSRF